MRRSHETDTAEFALKCVDEAAKAGPTSRFSLDDYVRSTKAAPALIMENGLLQTLAFYQEKRARGLDLLAVQIGAWLVQCHHLECAGEQVVSALVALPAGQYRLATADALGLLSWVRRLAAGRRAGPERKEGA